jgi:hypothetical protein
MVSRDWDWGGTVLSPILPQGALGLLSYPTTQPYLHQWWQSEHGGRGREDGQRGWVCWTTLRVGALVRRPTPYSVHLPDVKKRKLWGGGGG